MTEQGDRPAARRTPRARAGAAAKPTAKPTAKPAAKQTAKPTAKPSAKPAAKTAAKPTARPAAKSLEASMPASSASPPEQLQLYLLRHADAGDPMAWSGDDADRPLSTKGKRQARRLGSMLADTGWRPDVILTSPKLRASQTARIVGEAVGVKAEDESHLASAFELGDLEGVLAAHPDARRVVLVGHDPDFSSIASRLTGAKIELRKGAIARIDLSDAGATTGEGALRWLIPPGAVPD